MERTERPSKASKSAQDWVEAGFALLAQQGIEAVRVEALARTLGVTKGSFYWHFRDRDALLAALLTHWQSIATQAVIDRLDALGGTAAARVNALVQTTRHGQRAARIEHAIRAWAALDKQARAALQVVDARREEYVRNLLVEHGLSSVRAAQRARILYLALIGEFAFIAHGGSASGAGPWQELVRLVLS
jgi:AcrR family transcriptional regulator